MTITTQFSIGDKVLHLGQAGWTVAGINVAVNETDNDHSYIWYTIRHTDRHKINVRESALELAAADEEVGTRTQGSESHYV